VLSDFAELLRIRGGEAEAKSITPPAPRSWSKRSTLKRGTARGIAGDTLTTAARSGRRKAAKPGSIHSRKPGPRLPGRATRLASTPRCAHWKRIWHDESDDLILLFTPPFDKTTADVGYIKGYPPGVRRNGGQYHARRDVGSARFRSPRRWRQGGSAFAHAQTRSNTPG
jgi:hypothetical protein